MYRSQTNHFTARRTPLVLSAKRNGEIVGRIMAERRTQITTRPQSNVAALDVRSIDDVDVAAALSITRPMVRRRGRSANHGANRLFEQPRLGLLLKRFSHPQGAPRAQPAL